MRWELPTIEVEKGVEMKKSLILLSFLFLTSACEAFTVTATAGPNGEVGPKSTVEIEAGGYFFFRADCNSNYVVDKWYLDGQAVQRGGWDFRLYKVHGDHTVHVTFIEKKEEYVINVTHGPNGHAVRTHTYLDWIKFTVKAYPDHGYAIDQWFLDGEPIQFGHNDFASWPGHDRDIHVTFKPLQIDSKTLEFMLSHWGEKECWTAIPWHCDCFDADLNFDRRIDMCDFAILAERWLKEGTLAGIQIARIFSENLEIVRTAIEEYRIDHNGVLPSRERFEVMMCSVTDSEGNVWVDAVSTGTKFGPYLKFVPSNPFTRGNDIDGNDDWYYNRETGEFAAVFGSEDDITSGDIFAEYRLYRFLRIIRDAIKRYHADHDGKFPVLPEFEAQMTGLTDVGGSSLPPHSEIRQFGPYLECIPINPFTGDNCVISEESGWSDYWYDEETGTFRFGDPYTCEDGTLHTQL